MCVYVLKCVGYKARDETFVIRSVVIIQTLLGASRTRFLLKMLSLRFITYLYHISPPLNCCMVIPTLLLSCLADDDLDFTRFYKLRQPTFYALNFYLSYL